MRLLLFVDLLLFPCKAHDEAAVTVVINPKGLVEIMCNRVIHNFNKKYMLIQYVINVGSRVI